jgi:spermidine/putrescine transport system permease protein
MPSPAHPAEPGASGLPSPAHPAEPGASGLPTPAHPAEPAASGLVNENRFASAFLIPGGLWLLLLFVTPLVFLLALSFGYTDDLGEAIYSTELDNYERLVDPDYVPVLFRSVGFALAAVVLCLLIGYPVAYYIAVFGGRWKNVLIALVVLPFFVNYLIRTYAWIAMLGDDGLVNGVLDSSIRFINTPYAVVGGLVYGFLTFMILPIYAALDRMDPSLIEAGKDLYGGPWETFRHVTLPHSMQGVLAGSLLVFLPAVGDFVAASLLGGPEEVMIGNLIQQQFQASDNWPFGAALTIAMMAFLLILMSFYLRAAAREAKEARA